MRSVFVRSHIAHLLLTFLRFVQPKYIVDLLAKAEDRKKEQDIIHERKLLKVRLCFSLLSR